MNKQIGVPHLHPLSSYRIRYYSTRTSHFGFSLNAEKST